jgi:hypothetical protein
MPSHRPAVDAGAALSARRPVHAHEVRAQAAAPAQRPSLRERLAHTVAPQQDAFPSLDHDWDIPAFQRKQR